jgi:hypothetical protein
MLPFDVRRLWLSFERSSTNAERSGLERTTNDRVFKRFAMLAGGGADAGHEA